MDELVVDFWINNDIITTMPNILTKNQVTERLLSDNRGIKLIGDYLGARKKTLFECSTGHKWMAAPRSVFGGNGCPQCASNLPLSKDIVNHRLTNDNRGITMIGEYITANIKSLFRCACSHEWLARPGHVLKSSGCPKCSDTSLTKDIINDRLNNDNSGITLIGECLGASSKTLFRCESNHEWYSEPRNVLSGKGCPSCRSYGFNPNKIGTAYLLDFGTHIKYGISNNIERRLTDHKKNGCYDVIMMVEGIGHQIMKWEDNIKQNFGGRYINKISMPDGWTETLPPNLTQDIVKTMIALSQELVLPKSHY